MHCLARTWNNIDLIYVLLPAQTLLRKRYTPVSMPEYLKKLHEENKDNPSYHAQSRGEQSRGERLAVAARRCDNMCRDMVDQVVDAARGKGSATELRDRLRTQACALATEYVENSDSVQRDIALAKLVAVVCCGRSFVDAFEEDGESTLESREYLFEVHPMQMVAVLSFFVMQRALPWPQRHADGGLPPREYVKCWRSARALAVMLPCVV